MNSSMSTMTETKPAPSVELQLRAPIGTGPNLSSLLGNYKKSFEAIAPKIMDVNRMLRIAILAISRNQDLLECSGTSVLGSLILATQMGLDIGAGEAHLVPFRNKHNNQRECQLIPDFKGVAKLIRNTGLVKNCRAHVVYRQDIFEYEEGTNPKLIHKPNLDHEFKNEDIIGAYNIAVFTDGYIDVHFISRRYLNAVKVRSKAKTGPWHAQGDERFDFAEMCRKTALKNHSKTLPRSVELAQALAIDHRAEIAAPQHITLSQEPFSGLLVADVPVDEQIREEEHEDLTPAQPKASAIDRIVEQHKKPEPVPSAATPASTTPVAESVKPAGGPEPCDKSDIDNLEILATDCGVLPKKWKKHIESMGFAAWDLLTKDRLAEVRQWIEAQKKA